ncbi:hypothetical protein [Sphingomonas kyeonggiensis]|uniref:Uncharacterized protein n=1 Tax=Sphingomonas kyeonggiensis TaxID=1268553 RepID=A0A7W6NVK5_9SPHN|nr:hypothetical protein [Sphingomonas kyeonggiensis]MBB4097552.1 hypothetical protein [Sphingomonas kyeonggiensis]
MHVLIGLGLLIESRLAARKRHPKDAVRPLPRRRDPRHAMIANGYMMAAFLSFGVVMLERLGHSASSAA